MARRNTSDHGDGDGSHLGFAATLRATAELRGNRPSPDEFRNTVNQLQTLLYAA